MPYIENVKIKKKEIKLYFWITLICFLLTFFSGGGWSLVVHSVG